MNELGKLVSTLRQKKGWSLIKLSEQTGIAVSTLHGIERGANPSFEKVNKLADALDVPVTDLLYPTDEDKAKATEEIQNILRLEFYDKPAIDAFTFLLGQIKDENLKNWFTEKIKNNNLSKKTIQNLVELQSKYFEYQLYRLYQQELKNKK